MPKNKILVTAALPYINNVPHMGHIVGSHLPADIFYRYCKSEGHEVVFVGGSDEHGTPSAVAAKELGLSIQDLVDKLNEIHKKVYNKLMISYTNYSRTSSLRHHEVVKDIFNCIYEKGFVYTGKTESYFCKNDRIFLPGRFVFGTCPKCGYDYANTDQCESCNAVFDSTELLAPHCKICGSIPDLKESEHLYLDLGKLSQRLNEWVEQQKEIWRPHVYSEAKKWINDGLRSRTITRDLEWGIKVPTDVLRDKVFYVWFDAPIGYITFTKELGEKIFEEYWKNSDSKIFHFLGKDNIPFHTIFWPAILLAHGEINLPSNVIGLNYLNFEGKKFSKSKGIGVFCYNLLDSDIDVDTLRSYLVTVIPETKDSDFTWEGFKTITNNELIAKLGNFFNRTLNLIWTNFKGSLRYSNLTDLNTIDEHLITSIMKTPTTIGELFYKAEFRKAYVAIMEYAGQGNIYLDRTKPWRLIKEKRYEETKKVLYLALNLCKSLAIVSNPILPRSMQNVWNKQLNFNGEVGRKGLWEESREINIPREHKINIPKPLFSKIDDKILAKYEKHFSKPHPLKELVGGQNITSSGT